ncbi:AraC family transcriptional regulator [Azospirillum agricola]|uniref:AraC family transcriptional regulator n=1 Tax=Azospirillum agricola TaxID=1720247 RepID=UPI000A0F2682|nr:AraC family transcriptional regulator [Azospirillum agricola]SMH30798.1 transcriptional regulator, AraC family [Azospirillum lipoferum]
MMVPDRLAAPLAALIERYAGEDGVHATALPRVVLIRSSRPTEPLHTLHEPALCIVAQGRKQVMLGERVLFYDAAQYLVVSVDLPVVGQVVEASPERPYLCLRLDLDPATLGALMMEAGLDGRAAGDRHADGREAAAPGLSLSPVTPELLDAAARLLRLLDNPRDAAVLAPLAEREILYRLLIGAQAGRLRQIAQADSRLQQVNRAIAWIKRNYAAPFSIDAVTAEARMSRSALHQHFKAVTAMSPLQYQKQLRLQEARRQILGRTADAATAGFNVGYDSPSQFSREYRRLFGEPPMRDAARLHASPGLLVGA